MQHSSNWHAVCAPQRQDASARRIQEKLNMIQINRILCPVDFSAFSKRAFAQAVALARWYKAHLTVLHVSPDLAMVDLPPIGMGDRDRARLFAELQRFTGHPVCDVPLDLVITEAADVCREILDRIDTVHADLLVMGSHGRSGVQRLLLGSVAERVLRQAPCPTLIVPRGAAETVAEPWSPPFKRILCAVDFSDGSRRALSYGIALSEEVDARLTVLHVIDPPPKLEEAIGPAGLDVDAVRAAAEAQALRRLRELIPDEARTYCTIETAVREGLPFREILKVTAEGNADLIVIGVQGRGAISLAMFGSTAARVTRAAPCATLVVPVATAVNARRSDFDRAVSVGPAS
jgi:nucleotide-binding universal stress UspA family protein